METTEYRRMFQIENHHWWYKSLHQLILGTINSLSLPKPPKILDAGCGTGALLAHLHQVGKAIGFDYSSLALQLAKKRKLLLLRASLNNLPFKNGNFDLVTCVSVLDQQTVKDQVALTEIFRVTKKGGYTILVVPAFPCLFSHHDKAVHAGKRYKIKEIYLLLKKAKFKNIYSQYIFSWLFPLFLIKRLSDKLIPVTKAVSDLSVPPRPINQILYFVCLLEWHVSRFLSLPFGSSILLVAKKNKR